MSVLSEETPERRLAQARCGGARGIDELVKAFEKLITTESPAAVQGETQDFQLGNLKLRSRCGVWCRRPGAAKGGRNRGNANIYAAELSAVFSVCTRTRSRGAVCVCAVTVL